MINPVLSLGATGADVAALQRRLNRRGANLAVDHVFGPTTDAAVRAFQRANGLVVDGIAGPRTQDRLLGLTRDDRALNQADIEAAASVLGCDVPAIQAVISVESPRGGFLPDGRVVILFERHVFYRRLKDAGIDPEPFVAARPDICNPKPGGYLGGSAEYARLAAAKQINGAIALESASWGRFQIMGEHWQALGFGSVADYVGYVSVSEDAQLRVFVKFLQADNVICQALIDHDWHAFAEGYNGPGYARNHYAARLAYFYALHGGEPAGQKADILSGPAQPEPKAAVAGELPDAGDGRRGPKRRKAKATA